MAKKEDLTKNGNDVQAPMPDTEVAATPTDTEVPVEENMNQEPQPEENAGESVKDKLIAIVQRFYPDSDVSTPEAVMASMLPLAENLVSFHDDLNEVVEEVPEFGDFLIGLRQGMTPQEAIAAYFDPETLTPPEEAPDNSAYMKAKEGRRKTIEERKEREAQREKNIEGSAKNIQALAEKRGWDEKKIKEFENKVAGLFNDWADGTLTPASLEVLEKGFSFDTALSDKEREMKEAVEDAKIAGRNEQIEKKRAKKETGDGTPKLSNTGSATTKNRNNLSVNDPMMPSRKLNFK